MWEIVTSLLGSAGLFSSLCISRCGARPRSRGLLRAALCLLVFCLAELCVRALILPLVSGIAALITGMVCLLFFFVLCICGAALVWEGSAACAAHGAAQALCVRALAGRITACMAFVPQQAPAWQNAAVLAASLVLLSALQAAFCRGKEAPSRQIWLLSALLYAAMAGFCLFPALYAGERLPFAAAGAAFFALFAALQHTMSVLSSVRGECSVLRETLARDQALRAEEAQMIDAVNLKSHDLKHLLLRGAAGALHGAYAEEARAALEGYERAFRTGNAALDVVLSEKAAACAARQVEFNCMADGTLLAGVKEADIYTMLGNLLDNAIEAVEGLEAGRRVVTLNIERRGAFCVLRTENYFAGELTFCDGLPATTKTEHGHGYGLRSVRMTASRLGGKFSCGAREDRFLVTVALPL